MPKGGKVTVGGSKDQSVNHLFVPEKDNGEKEIPYAGEKKEQSSECMYFTPANNAVIISQLSVDTDGIGT